MKEKIIKVGFCVAYDWVLLKKSIPLVYEAADIICLSIDKNRRTWSGKTYAFDEIDFHNFVDSIDLRKKIDVYEDDFSPEGLSAMENDTRQRMLMAKRMGPGGWHIQIDSDEYFLDFPNCVQKLKSINPNPTGNEKPINVCALCIPLIKRLPNGFLYVNFKTSVPETFPFATTRPDYKRARLSGHFNKLIQEFVIHETWARSDDDLWLKMNNWGHASEELNKEAIRLSYYNLWKILDQYNYQYIINFHPAVSSTWPALQFIQAATVEEFFKKFQPVPPLTAIQLWIRNSRNMARVKKILKMISKT